MGLIQTYDQLTFSYEAIIEGMRRMNNDVRVSFLRIHNMHKQNSDNGFFYFSRNSLSPFRHLMNWTI